VAIMSDFQPEGQWFKIGLCRRAVSLGHLKYDRSTWAGLADQAL